MINSWKEKDSENTHKLIYSLRLKGEETSQARRVFSKIFKLEENIQYGFAMTKRLPIGISKKKELATLEIMNEIVIQTIKLVIYSKLTLILAIITIPAKNVQWHFSLYIRT